MTFGGEVLMKQFQEIVFTPLENPSIYAGDGRNRKHQLLIPACRQAGRGGGKTLPFLTGFTAAFMIMFILLGTILIEPTTAYGQMRDPFSLPSGVRLLSKADSALATKRAPSILEGKPTPISSTSLKVSAILISDHIRLASIQRHIVTVGDSIQGEKILEIKNDRVILGKGDKKRTLYLSQVPIQLSVEEKQGEKR
jgi:hypothetical protein